MYILLSDDKHRKVRDSSKMTSGNHSCNIISRMTPKAQSTNSTEINSVQDKMQSENFFQMVGKKFFLDLILSQTEFCLVLNLSWTEFCLRLNLSWITYRSCISYAIF